MSTTIVIVTYNALPWIDRCLKSTAGFPVIVVDNSSTDDTVKYIKEHYPQAILLAQEKNLGFGQGNNMGITYALKKGADYVFLLNQDAYLVEDCIEILIKKQQEHPEYGILSPVHLNGKGDALDRNFANYISFQKAPLLLFDLLLKKEKDLYKVPFVNAAGWLLSKTCLETVGGFDPMFFHYGEDDNYCQRLRYHGWDIGIVLHAFMHHDREDREKKSAEKYSKEYFEHVQRRYKILFGDVNNLGKEALSKEVNRLKLLVLKERLKLRFSNAKNLKVQLKGLLKNQESIVKSRELNLKTGRNYL